MPTPAVVKWSGAAAWLLLLSLLLAVALPAASTNPFHNIVNRPFATRCNGPQGAIVIRDDVATTASAARRTAIARQHNRRKLAHGAATLRRLKSRGLVPDDRHLRMPRLAVHTCSNELLLPDLAQANGNIGDEGNNLTFEYQGWSDAEQATLQDYLNRAYPKAKLVYGPPAFDITVKIIRDDSISALQGGIYDATANEIRMPPLTGNVPEDTFILMLLILRAFHDDAAFFYDAWEQGFVGAAATAVQMQPGVAPDFNPIDPGPFYALSVYEPENHPELGNSTFFPEGDFGGMFVWRVAMARAAWLKCWIEDDEFFSKFNRQYYTQYSTELAGDVPGLREIGATVLPTVEGLPFQEWFERQYVLDTSVRAGLKEYTWNIPLENSIVLIVEHYFTDADGAEHVRGGQGKTTYWSYDFSVNLYAEEGNLIDIPTTGDTPGEGFLIPTFFNIGGPQRITVQLDLNDLRSFYPYPYGVRGFDPGDNNLYGGIIGAIEGTLDVEGGSGISELEVDRGVWGDRITTDPLRPLKLSVTFTNNEGQENSRNINIGWGSYAIFIEGGAQTTVDHEFAMGDTGLHLISLPVTPLKRSVPELLGMPSRDVLLARWGPTTPPKGGYNIWPDCQPFAIGRAFWLRILQDLQLSITGIPAPDEERQSIPLRLGWNMFGAVRLEPVPVDDMKVQVGSDTPVPFAEAVNNNLVQAGIFKYEQSSGYQPADDITPFHGYWVRCLTKPSARLVFEPLTASDTTTAAKDASRTLPEPDWKLPIIASTTGGTSSSAYLGVAPEATDGFDALYDMQAPPSFGSSVSVRFIDNGTARDRAARIADIRASNAAQPTWRMRVKSDIPDAPVQLKWPDMSGLPRDLQPMLYDPAADRRVYMRTTTGMALGGGDNGVERELEVTVRPEVNQGLTVSGMSAICRADAVSVAYTLSRAATVDARVLNIAGRPVRRLCTDRVQPAGVNSIVWNLRSHSQTMVPGGRYLIELRARASDGQAVKAVKSVRVRRR